MQLDFRKNVSYPPEAIHYYRGASCFVDSQIIHKVWFVDTNAGIVKTYDVRGDGKVHYTHEAVIPPPDTDIEAIDGVWSKTLRGTVTLERSQRVETRMNR